MDFNKVGHNDPDQKKRQKYARNEDRESTVSLNRKLKKGVFVGTSGVNYKTTLCCAHAELAVLEQSL